MSDQTVSVNFVAKSDQFLNPMNQMSKATSNFTNAGKIAKDVMLAVGVAGVAMAAAIRIPESAMKVLTTTFETGFAKISAAAAVGAAIIKDKMNNIGVSMAQGVGTQFVKNMALNIASLGFLDKAAIASGLAIAGGLYIAAKAAVAFQVNMQNVQSILQLSQRDFATLNEEVLKTSQKFPVAANDVAAAIYKIGSAGFTSLSDVNKIMTASALGATAGLASMTDSATTLVSVLNSYGLAAKDAAHVNDILFQGVKLGQFSYSELSGQLTSFIALAKNSGATLEETIGTYALLSKASGNAAESATYLSGVFRALIKPSADLSQALRLMGFDSGQTAIEQLGLVGTVKALGASVDNNSTSLSKLFPNVRALNGALAILNTSNTSAGDTMSQFTDATKLNGSAQKAYQTQLEAIGTKLKLLQTSFQAVGIEIGKTLLPALGVVATILTDFVSLIEKAPPQFTALIGIIGALSATLLIVGGSFLFVRSTLNLMKIGLDGLKITGLIESLKNATAGLGFMSTAAGVARSAFISLEASLGPVMLAFAGFQALATVNDNLSHVDTKVKALSNSLAEMGPGTDAVWKQLNSADFTSSKGLFGLIDKGYKFLFPFTEQFKTEMRSTDQAAALLVKNGNMQAAGKAIDQIIATVSQQKDMQIKMGIDPNAVDATAQAVKKLKDMFPAYNAAVQDATNNAKMLAAANGDSGLSLDKIMAKYGGAASAAISMGDAETYLQDVTDSLNYSQKALQSTLASFPSFTGSDALSSLTQAHQDASKAAANNTQAQIASITTPGQLIGQQLSLQQAIMGVTAARKALADAQSKNFSLDMKQAQEAIDLSYETTTRDVYALTDATKALNDIQHPSARTVDEANIAVQQALLSQQDAIAALAPAQDKLNLARDHALPAEVAQAERDLASAQMQVRTTGYALVDAQQKYNDLTQNTPAHQRAIKEATMNVADAQRAVGDSTDATTTAISALQAVRDQQKNQPQVIAAAELALKQALNGVTTAMEDMQKKEAGPQAAAATSTFDKNVDLQKQSLVDLSTQLETQITDQKNYWTNIDTIAKKYGPAVAGELVKMGRDGTSAVKQLADNSDANGKRFADDLISNAAAGSKTFLSIVQDNMSKAPGSVRTYTVQAMQALADELGIGVGKAKTILDGYGLTLENAAGSYLRENSPGNFVLINPNLTTIGGHGLPSAQGNIFESHSPQIARGGPTRIWAEPETGGEAYIPLGQGKRQRSVQLLKQVAGIFGDDISRYAEGGIILPDALTVGNFNTPGNKMITALPAAMESRVMRQSRLEMIQNLLKNQGGSSALLAAAQLFLGVPYHWGGGHGSELSVAQAMQLGLDCSGLVDQAAFKAHIKGLSGTTVQQQIYGDPVANMAAAVPGDLLLFAARAQGESHHVGIYAGGTQMINAPFTGTVVRYDNIGTPSYIRHISPEYAASQAVDLTPGASGNINESDFARMVLGALFDPASNANLISLVNWEKREGGNWHNSARYNPLNTTQREPGSGVTGTQGNIGVYTSWAQGVKATVDTLNNGLYDDILGALATGGGLGQGHYASLLRWSGGGYDHLANGGIRQFDSGGYLPPHSRTMAINGTSHWEPVGRGVLGTVTYHVPVNVEARVAANVDLDQASQIISDKVAQGIEVALQKAQTRVIARNGR